MSEEKDNLYGALEALLMIIDTPASARDLAAAVGYPEVQVEAALNDLQGEFAGENGTRARGFVLRQVSGGWRIYSNPQFHSIIESFILQGQTGRLTQAALETLAIVAYRQPCTRSQIGAIRGVNVDGVVRNLQARGLIQEAGVGEGGGILYETSPEFLEQLGLNSLDELPPLAPYMPAVEEIPELASGLEEGTK